MSRWVSLDEAARGVPDGASVAPGGFLLGRAPMALIFAIIRARRRELRIVSLPNPLPAELRVAAGCATRVELLAGALTLGNRVRPMPALDARSSAARSRGPRTTAIASSSDCARRR